MKNNIKLAKKLVRIAKSLIALDITIDNDGDTGDYSLNQTQGNPKEIHDKYEQNKLDEAEKQGKKYILHHKEGNLWRIQACKDFSSVNKGDFGGLIQKEENLSHEGYCWVFSDAKIYDNAKVYGNAWVQGSAQIYNHAQIYGYAQIYDNAQVSGNAKVYGYAQVLGNALVFGNAKVYDNATVNDNALVFGNANVFGNAQVYGNVKVNYQVKDKKITE